MAKEEIKIVDSEQFRAIIDSEKNHKYSPFGLFLVKEREDLYIACDNSTGDAWTEEFTELEAAEKFLRGEDETDEDFDEEYDGDFIDEF